MADKPARANIIFVLTDDQGYGDLSCLGNPILKTPALDRLHAYSVRLTDFHVAPMCSPTRGELMTGQDALRNGATFVCMGRSLLRADLPTMADILAGNGYHTGHFGKWHLGDNFPYRPQDRGFHETIHHPAFGITSAADYFGNDYFDDHYRHKDEIKQYRGYCTDVWFEEAIRWMQGCHNRNEPFFAYIATNAPHGPLWVPDEYRQPYLNGIRRDEASFFGMIANIDENMAQLERFLLDKRHPRQHHPHLHDRQRHGHWPGYLQCGHARQEDFAVRGRAPRALFHSLAAGRPRRRPGRGRRDARRRHPAHVDRPV